jgi:hypothetical protein
MHLQQVPILLQGPQTLLYVQSEPIILRSLKRHASNVLQDTSARIPEC